MTMARNSRLSFALHVLLHMSASDEPLTSEALAPKMKTNPVVLRRSMAGLRDAGIVRSVKGHRGGWSLARKLDDVTLADVYDALGLSAPFAIGHHGQTPKCLLERAANRALTDAMAEAEALLMERFRRVTVADVLATTEHKSAKTSARSGRRP
jgi:Rrf2 family protein